MEKDVIDVSSNHRETFFQILIINKWKTLTSTQKFQ